VARPAIRQLALAIATEVIPKISVRAQLGVTWRG
jgi:hypothetical protein